MILAGYSGAQGTLIYEKNLNSKISCQTSVKKDIIMNYVVLFLTGDHFWTGSKASTVLPAAVQQGLP
jgi:hypothetical protein